MKKILIMVGMLIACSMAGTLKDNRDGKTYKTVKIGNQVWMAENLNYEAYGSACYDYKDANCKKYGRFYTWGGAQNACPAGWHLPTKEEWGTLLSVVSGKETAGRALKSSSGWWKGINGDGFDNYGFSALPAGSRNYSGNFDDAGYSAFFWSASQDEYRSNYAYYVNLYYSSEYARMDLSGTINGYSVRCLQNSNEERDVSLVRPSEAGAANKQNQESMRDSRDGKIYKTVKIGNQTWMAENLNYKTKESVCYDNMGSNCEKDGLLYTWEEAKMVCPAGWHLPTKEEWGTLLKNVGGKETAGRALKSRHGWNDDGNGFDNYGFSALPAGYSYIYGDFGDAGSRARFWSASEYNNSLRAYYMYLRYDGEDAYLSSDLKYYGFSVRCLQNSHEEREASLVRPSEAGAANKQNQGSMKDSRDGKTYKTVKIGNQTWMAENLNYKTSGSMCYDYKDANCKKYGRLYTWGGAQNACPAGWHLPTKKEFGILLIVVGGKETAGRVLKSRRGWVRENGENDDGFDNYGFSALPAGRRLNNGNFYSGGDNAYFWSASQVEYRSDYAYFMPLDYAYGNVRMSYGFKNYGYSVRCLQNSNEEREASLVRPSEAGAANKQNQGSVKDSRDGKTYKTVKIGNQVWMAENLNYKTKESVCYGNKDANCKEYGRLYTWGGAQNVCPAGWHLPTKEEWGILLENVGGEETAGRALKSRRGWYDDDNGFDNYGFSALPAGSRNYYGSFYDAGNIAFFWSASERSSNDAYSMDLYYYGKFARMGYDNKSLGYSVRCLQNSNEERDASLVRPSEAGAANKQNQGGVKDSRDGKTYKTVKIGDQVWMAENLNVKTDEGSWCYENKPENCERYGRLYDWATAMDLPAFCNKTCEITVEYPHQGICPKGYHVPTREELETLMDAVGGSSVAGSKLKSTSDWSNRGDGTDVYGFSALPAGDGFSGDIFYDVADSAIFWSASGTFTHYAYTMGLGNGETGNVSYNARLRAFSIRCLKDSNPGNGDESSEEDSEE